MAGGVVNGLEGGNHGREETEELLGATALLAEILNDEMSASRDEGEKVQDAETSSAKQDDDELDSPISRELKKLRERAQEEQQSPELEAAAPAGNEEENEGADAEKEEKLSQEVQNLHQEMESFLGSLDNWEEDSRKHREEMKRKLAEQYGFSYEEALGSWQGAPEAWGESELPKSPAGSTQPLMDFDRQEEPEHPVEEAPITVPGSRLGEAELGAPGRFGGGSRVSASVREPLPGEMGSLAALRADEERLAKLRQELEELKKRDGFQQPRSMAETGGRGEEQGRDSDQDPEDRFSPRRLGPEDIGMEGLNGLLDATSTSVGIGGEADLNSTLGLSAWCDELAAALKMEDLGTLQEPDPEDPDATQLMSMERIGDIELRLQGARDVVGQMEHALESACGRMNEQLEELDRLQAECDEYQAQMARPRAG